MESLNEKLSLWPRSARLASLSTVAFDVCFLSPEQHLLSPFIPVGQLQQLA